MGLSNFASTADDAFRSPTRSVPVLRALVTLVLFALFSALGVDHAQAGVILDVSSESAHASSADADAAPDQDGYDDGQVERRSNQSMPAGAGTSFGGATSVFSFALLAAPGVVFTADCSSRSLDEGAVFLPDSPLFERLQPPRALV